VRTLKSAGDGRRGSALTAPAGSVRFPKARVVAAWLIGLREEDEVEFPQSGHSVINLPPTLKGEIGAVAAAEKKSKTDWIIDRLEQCVRDEQSVSSLKERAKRLSEIQEWAKTDPISAPEPQTSKAV
jgi:hypothetical protein